MANPSLLTFSFSALSSKLNIFLREMSGTSLAKRSASPNGNSITRAVSRMEDLAAMVPYVMIWATWLAPYLSMT